MSLEPALRYGTANCAGKRIVITGANGGIGKVTARELAKAGASIVMACRDIAAAGKAADEIRRQTGNGDISVVHLDLASFSSVRACAGIIAERWGKIDVLLNNAGTYTQGDTLTADGIHPTMQVNYFSPFLLTSLLLPLIAAAGRGRIVNVTSAMYAIGRIDLGKPGFMVRRNGFSAYAGSKLALLLSTLELAERLAGTGMTANALHPGLVDTKIMRLDKWYDIFIRLYMDMKAVDVEEGAKTSVYLASSGEVAEVSGKYFVDREARPPNLGRRWLDMRRDLWERTGAVVGAAPLPLS